jgi:hypothetical protein
MTPGSPPTKDEFLGREEQLKVLSEAWQSSDSAFLPVYGRRRVGKSELILHFLEDKPGLAQSRKSLPLSPLAAHLELAVGSASFMEIS